MCVLPYECREMLRVVFKRMLVCTMMGSKDNHRAQRGGEQAAGFYGTLLASKRWWAAELQDEGVMGLSLPSPAPTTPATS